MSAKPSQASSRAKARCSTLSRRKAATTSAIGCSGWLAAGADHLPAVLERPVEALLAVEVVRDELLVDSGPGGDRADPRAGETMLAELDHSGVEDALAGALGITLAVLAAGGPARLGHSDNP